MKMDTLSLQIQKPTVKKRATTTVDVQQTNRTMGAIKERMKTTDTSKTTDWEKKLYANGDVFSKDFVDSSKLFTLWNEGVEKSEIMFANYQQSLLYVLQHLYSYLYSIETLDSNELRTDEKARLANAIEKIAKDNVTHKEFFNNSNPTANMIVKIAYSKQYVNATESNRRSLQKRLSSYANVLNNALTKGEKIKGKTDAIGRIEPKHFQSVVLANGGISVFSRMTEKAIKLNAELKEQGYESVNARTIAEFKKGISNGEMAHSIDKDIKVEFLNIALDESCDEHIHIKEGEYALALINKKEGANVVTCFSTTSSGIDNVMVAETKNIEDELDELAKIKINPSYADEIAKKKTEAEKQRQLKAKGMTKAEVKMLTKLQKTMLKHGGIENTLSKYDEYCEGSRLIDGKYAFADEVNTKS